ncbi:MAG: hypothetical protein KC653_02980, partial [Candidatus Andersenbacteria bacterium]|nr:hypothetical protein [Candidatus Andersenbacteria bacterium]
VLIPDRDISDQGEIDDLIDDVEDDNAADDLADEFPGFVDPLNPPGQPGIDPVNPGLDLPDFDPNLVPGGILNPGDMDLNAEIIHRGATRAIVRFDDPRTTPEQQAEDLTFLYAPTIPGVEPGAEGHQSATIYSDDQGFYVVLEGLEGGGFDDVDEVAGSEDELVNGRKDYYFQVRAGEFTTQILSFFTLNRRQAILYIYGLVFGDEFSAGFEEEIADGFDYTALRGGGPAFFYDPPAQEPLSLAGVKYALMNDPLREFDIRLFFTARATSVEESVEQLYRVIFDRIYPEDLTQICDATGCAFWAEQVEQNNADRITLSGVKFALFNSTEYRNSVRATSSNEELTNAELAYHYVLRRGADLAGRENLAEQGDNVNELRLLLAQSDEFEERLGDTEEDEGRRAAINELYEGVFGRASDVEGLDYWTSTRSDLEVLEIRDLFLKGE